MALMSIRPIMSVKIYLNGFAKWFEPRVLQQPRKVKMMILNKVNLVNGRTKNGIIIKKDVSMMRILKLCSLKSSY